MEKKRSFSIHLGAVKGYRPSDLVVFSLLAIFLLTTTLGVLFRLFDSVFIDTPMEGSTLVEGVLGVPKSLNPLYAESSAEMDISALLHRRLVRNPTGSKIIKDLATKWSISEDNTRYTFTILSNATFHDGTPIKTDDVVFTINLLEDIDSRLANKWDKVFAEKLSETEFAITLPAPDIDFIYNADLPILSEDKWSKVRSENLKTHLSVAAATGSGLYSLETKKTTIDGSITELTLTKANKQNIKPYIHNIIFRFFETRKDLVEAFEKGTVDSISNVTPIDLNYILQKKDNNFSILKGRSNKVFGLFFNINESSILSDIYLRGILSEAIDRRNIIENIFGIYALPINGPSPEDAYLSTDTINTEKLRQTLEDFGWRIQEDGTRKSDKNKKLEIRIAIPDAEEFQKIASLIVENLEELDAIIHIEPLTPKELEALVSLDGYNAILYGYNFSHKSAGLSKIWSKDSTISTLTGFNVVSTLAEEEPGQTINSSYNLIRKSILKNIPAVFIYSPDFVYLFNKNILGVNSKQNMFENFTLNRLDLLNSPSDRFNSILDWHTDTKKIFRLDTDYKQ